MATCGPDLEDRSLPRTNEEKTDYLVGRIDALTEEEIIFFIMIIQLFEKTKGTITSIRKT